MWRGVNKLLGILLSGWFACGLHAYATEQISVGGFLAQGGIAAPDSNFVNDDGRWSSKLTELGLNAYWQLKPSISLAGQLTYQQSGNRYAEGLRADYLYLQWLAYEDAQRQLQIQLGRVKNQHWLYSATRNIPHTRPSIILPQSMYFDGFRDTALSSDGLSVHASQWFDWGELELRWSRGDRAYNDKEKTIILSPVPQGQIAQPFVEQVGVYTRLAEQQLTLGINYLDSMLVYHPQTVDPFSYGELSFNQWKLMASYGQANYQLDGEYLYQRVTSQGFFAPTFFDRTHSEAWYVQGQYHWSGQWRGFARYDKYTRHVSDRQGLTLQRNSGGAIPAFFAYQDTVSLGLSYQVGERLQLQVESHWVKGTGRLTPLLIPNVMLNNREHWQITAIQLMYWF